MIAETLVPTHYKYFSYKQVPKNGYHRDDMNYRYIILDIIQSMMVINDGKDIIKYMMRTCNRLRNSKLCMHIILQNDTLGTQIRPRYPYKLQLSYHICYGYGTEDYVISPYLDYKNDVHLY